MSRSPRSLKEKHLFMNDIAGLADGADKKFGGFEERRAYLFKSGSIEKNAGFFLDPLPFFNLTRKDICPFRGNLGYLAVISCGMPSPFRS